MVATKILFICIGNTCRSPMAEAMARSLGGPDIEAYSAGIAPTGRISPHVIRVLGILGFAADDLRSKGLDAVDAREMDVIVSLMGDDGLRFIPGGHGARVESWPVRDPYGEDERVFLATARVVERHVRALLDDLHAGELTLG